MSEPAQHLKGAMWFDPASGAQLHLPRRTPDAQADIAAARGAPTPIDAMVDAEVAAAERDAAIADLAHQPNRTLDGLLSNAALADTPAVREMGGPRNMQTDLAHAVGTLERIHKELWPHRDPLDVTLDDLVHAVATLRIERDEARQHGERMRMQLEQSRQPGAIILTGPEAEQYRALQAAARKAQASAATARADGAALLQLFQAFCAGIAPGKEG